LQKPWSVGSSLAARWRWRSTDRSVALVLSVWRRLVGMSLLTTLGGCAPSVELAVNEAPGYSSHGQRISVLGVYKNGRMDAGAWAEWQPVVAAAVPGAACAPAYGDEMEQAEPDLFAEFDDYVREHGITDEILDRLSGVAKGGSILVIQAFGKPPTIQRAGDVPAQTPSPPPPTRGRGRGRGGNSGQAGANPASVRPREEANELSAGLYSLEAREVVASVDLKYPAASARDAITDFNSQFRAITSGAVCAGWKWQAH
jgi:hypothetical protein